MSTLRIALRTLRKQPGFAAVAIASLGLAIALATTMDGMLDALINPRLDMRAPERLYWVRMYGDYRMHVDEAQRDAAVRAGLRTYEGMVRYEPWYLVSQTVIARGANERQGAIARVSGDYFDFLGARPLLGRTFIASDTLGDVHAIVLGEAMAAQLFPDGTSPVGATLTLERVPYTVVGVVSRRADFPGEHTAAWIPSVGAHRGMYIRLMRMREGVTRRDVEREMAVVAARIAAAAGEPTRDVAFRFQPATDPQFHYSNFHYALIAAVAAVLLIACANLANLQLARGIGRRRELALRAALGADRRALVAGLLVESGLLAAAGLAIGLVLALWGGKSLAAAVPPSVGKFVVEPQTSWRVLAFSAAVTVLCLVLVGLAPALTVSRVDPNDLLKSGAGTGTTRRNRRRYGFLVVLELALALALVSGAGVMLRTLARADDVRYTIDVDRLAQAGFAFQVADSAGRSTGTLRLAEVAADVVERVRAMPEVADAAVSTHGRVLDNAITVSDAGGAREAPAPLFGYTVVSPGYFRTMGLRILEGRDFREGERDEPAVIVDRQTARVLWPNARAVGSQIKLGAAKSSAPYARVVGIVESEVDVSTIPVWRRPPIDRTRPGRIYYLPGPDDTVPHIYRGRVDLEVVARTRGDPQRLAMTLRRGLRELPGARVFQAISMDDYLGLSANRASQRFVAVVFCVFGALALFLAAFGVYGIVAYAVAARRRELGVRIALGASSRDILHAVLREESVLALAGVALGLLLAKYGVRLLAGYAHNDYFYDAPLFAVVALVLVSIVGGAALVPARRATRVDPVESLRND